MGIKLVPIREQNETTAAKLLEARRDKVKEKLKEDHNQMQSPIYMAKSSICSIIGIELEKCIGDEEAQLLVDSLVYALIGCVVLTILLSICGCCYCHSSRKKDLLIKRLTFYHTDAIK